MRYLILLTILASCGSDYRTVCREEFEYKYNGYSYVEYKKLKCEDIKD